MTRRFLFFVLALAGFVPFVLLADSPGPVPQLLLGAMTAGFLWLATRGGPVERRQIVTAIVVAATGECILSIGLGLYDYRNALIPLYVFFGHGIFYALAAEGAQQRMLQQAAPLVVRATLIFGSILSGASLVLLDDRLGLVWWVAAAVLIARARDPLLLSICFVCTMLLEWVGTGIGNWTWATAANPPSGVGVLYVVLDLVTVTVAARGALTPSFRAAAPVFDAGSLRPGS